MSRILEDLGFNLKCIIVNDNILKMFIGIIFVLYQETLPGVCTLFLSIEKQY